MHRMRCASLEIYSRFDGAAQAAQALADEVQSAVISLGKGRYLIWEGN
jgi:hypothetical protein